MPLLKSGFVNAVQKAVENGVAVLKVGTVPLREGSNLVSVYETAGWHWKAV